MKSMSFYLLSLALLAFLGACGKNNESGKYSNPYYTNQYGVINSPYDVVNRMMQSRPCRGAYGQAHQNRVQVQQQIQLSQYASVNPNDIFVGSTTAGDIGVVIGGNANTRTGTFIGYICQRDVQFTNAQPMINNVKLGMYTNCNPGFKTLISLNLALQFTMGYGQAGYPQTGYQQVLPFAFADVCI